MSSPIDWDHPQYERFRTSYNLTAEELALRSAFVPSVIEARLRAFEHEMRFAHYTTAEAAVAIVRSSSVWLRNSNAMNDYSELHHGIERVISFFFRDGAAKPFWERIGKLQPGLDAEIAHLYNSWLSDLRYNSYMMCVSEHKREEDGIGRLSMWRAYGQPNGVCIVFNGKPFHNSSDAIKTYSYPVLYWSDDELKTTFKQIVGTLCASVEVTRVPREELKGLIYKMLEMFSIGLKHPGFGEELEWRVVHRPGQNPSERVTCGVQTVRGVPQRVYSLPLQNFDSEGLRGLAVPDVIDGIIVGPCQHPLVVGQALVDVLKLAGLVDPEARVIVSDIPLRT